ncbi:hypothetical protein V6N12_029993 [Hibiscus sabdariffa]|uniref:Growth-regulating factor n=1 Tax=Hibiscus sabdariffa TaxID=183260 RepID=A0ABR1Z6N1_9ROSI
MRDRAPLTFFCIKQDPPITESSDVSSSAHPWWQARVNLTMRVANNRPLCHRLRQHHSFTLSLERPFQTPILRRGLHPFHEACGGGSGPQEWLEGKRGTVKMEEDEEEKEGLPSIKLGLGIADGRALEKSVKKHGKCVFTTAQLHELQLQTLIFKYIAAGIQVPVSLVLPIWKSVATASVGSAHGGAYQRCPSFVGVSPQGIDHRNMVDPEPGRCRRTDGKKWRCSKNAIPDEKYCLQHMHRGCRRSRKPVETSQTALHDSTSSKIPIKLSGGSKSLSAPVSSQYMNQSFCNASASHETPAVTAMVSNNVCSIRNSIYANATTSGTIINAAKNADRNDSKRIKIATNASEKCEEKLSVSDGGIINRSCKSINKVIVANNMSPTVGFSPKSILQGNNGSCVYKNEIERQPGRCRRTDGKRWRCSRDVITNQKYCARHMHRGARKHAEVSQPLAASRIGDCQPGKLTIANKPTCSALSTRLSISIPSPPLITQDEKSTSSSSETTISDTTVTLR